ncbi:hypothetical protein FBY35_1910 [Streptomyces sp. SLBN-118]|uniref:hypothetical protein n=1 Tax=Streptomyces sp. SLBN-118 TaxID=2768454 RepID=UPI001153CA5D|nr:hypothetical protein [Streptomyces sp. SLBN-118]TQK51507.1 hypothetical protein FBY35_1910 [Streptomyces sp. SLBN-118]
MGRTGTTRRRALIATGAAAVTALTGCSNEDPERGRTANSDSDPVRAETALRGRLAAASAALRDHYDAVMVHLPVLTGQLSALRTAVAEHVTALGGTSRVAPTLPVPADAPAALRSLAAAERRTGDAYTAALLDAEPELARLLASVAAAGATHEYLLTKGGSQ